MSTITIADLGRLSAAERIQLAEDLWDSVAAERDAVPITDRQRQELDRRLAEHDADPDAGTPWESVRARLLGSR